MLTRSIDVYFKRMMEMKAWRILDKVVEQFFLFHQDFILLCIVFFPPNNYLTTDFLFEFIFTLTVALVTDAHVRILWNQPSSNSKDWCQSFELNIANVIFDRGFAMSFEHWFWCDVLVWFGIVVLIWNGNILAYK